MLYLCAKGSHMLEDFRIKVFMTVVREGSFTKAASSLGVSQPAVSQNIAELEKATGVKLFERLRSEVRLTPQGEIFMDYARRIVDSYDSVTGMFSPLPSTVVRISASEEIYEHLLSPALDAFLKVHPEIVLERTLFEEADLRLSLVKSTFSPFDTPAGAIIRLSVSAAPVMEMGDFSATHHSVNHFHVLYQPSVMFARTKLCKLLKDFLVTF